MSWVTDKEICQTLKPLKIDQGRRTEAALEDTTGAGETEERGGDGGG